MTNGYEKYLHLNLDLSAATAASFSGLSNEDPRGGGQLVPAGLNCANEDIVAVRTTWAISAST